MTVVHSAPDEDLMADADPRRFSVLAGGWPRNRAGTLTEEVKRKRRHIWAHVKKKVKIDGCGFCAGRD